MNRPELIGLRRSLNDKYPLLKIKYQKLRRGKVICHNRAQFPTWRVKLSLVPATPWGWGAGGCNLMNKKNWDFWWRKRKGFWRLCLLISIILFYVPQGAQAQQKNPTNQPNNSSINFVICWIGKEHLSRDTVLGIYVGLMIWQKWSATI